MNKILFALLTGLIFGCAPASMEKDTDVADRVSGRYVVQYYIVDKDTVWSSKGINKLGVSDFYIRVSKIKADSVSVMKEYKRSGLWCGEGNFARIQKLNSSYRIIAANATDVYESSVSNGLFYERTVGMNPDPLKRRWDIDSLKSAYTPPNREIIVLARKE